MIYEFPGLAAIDDEDLELDDRALDALARDLDALTERHAAGLHPCDVARDELAARHSITRQLLAQGLELRDARLTAAVWATR